MESKIRELFADIDRMDTEKFLSYLTDDATFKFANFPPAEGRDGVREAVDNFFASIKGLSHSLNHVWVVEGHCIVQGDVTYTRLDDKQVTVPFCNTFGMNGELVREYNVHIDPSPLFAE